MGFLFVSFIYLFIFLKYFSKIVFICFCFGPTTSFELGLLSVIRHILGGLGGGDDIPDSMITDMQGLPLSRRPWNLYTCIAYPWHLLENREEEMGVVGSEKRTKALSQRVWK